MPAPRAPCFMNEYRCGSAAIKFQRDAARAEFDLPVNREIGKIPLRFDLSVKISFTDKLSLVYIACSPPWVHWEIPT